MEDDVDLADAVCSYLRAKAFVVDVVGRLDEARSALLTAQYSAVLLDLHLEDGDGLSLMPAVRALREQPAVIVLTARDQVSDRIRGLDAGADDYLTKPYDPGELLARLRAVQRRSSGGESVVQLGSLQIDLAHDMVRRDGVPVVLTQKEWALLRVMAMRPERIHTRDALQDALYGFDDEADSNTLEVFVSRLRRKLGRDHIQTLRGLGYRLAFSPRVDVTRPGARRPRLADRLARTLMLWVGGVWLACVLGATWYVDREINHNFDNEMIESAHRMVDIAVHELDQASASGKLDPARLPLLAQRADHRRRPGDLPARRRRPADADALARGAVRAVRGAAAHRLRRDRAVARLHRHATRAGRSTSTSPIPSPSGARRATAPCSAS